MENNIKRINFLDLPVDAVDPDNTFKAIVGFLQDCQGHQVTLLNINKLLKARRDLEYQRCIKQSSLILPISRGIVRGVKKKIPLYRYNPFEFIIRVLILAEKLNRTIYLLGSKKEELEKAEKNLKTSYPNLKVIGRHSGYFGKQKERDIILAIRKASPSFLLVGKGIRDQDKWISRNRKHFNPGVFIWVDNCFEIFSGKEKNISKRLFKLGLESISGILKKPWKVFRIFPYLYFKILVLIYKIRGF